MRELLCVAVLMTAAGTLSCSAPKPACSAQNCTGCCDASGACVSGTSQQACGTLGAQCSTCQGIEVCTFGVCQLNTNVGGGVGSSGGGAGTTGGGVGVTGGGVGTTGGGVGTTGDGGATGGGSGSTTVDGGTSNAGPGGSGCSSTALALPVLAALALRRRRRGA